MDGEKNRENKFLWMWKKEMKKQKQTVPAFGEANWKSIEVQQHSIILYDGWFFKHIDSDSIGARFFLLLFISVQSIRNVPDSLFVCFTLPPDNCAIVLV